MPRWEGRFEGVHAIGRMLIGIGLFLLVAGVVIIAGDRLLGLGRLPGDIVIRRGSFTFYFPVVTSILLSVLLSLILWGFNRLR